MCIFLSMLIASSVCAQKVYFWTDEKGVKQATTTPPPDNIKQHEVDSYGKRYSHEEIQRGDKKGQKQPPVTMEQFPVNITIKQPDSIGNVYIDATYTNNSNRNIVGFQMTVLIKDRNEKTYLSNYDTVLPGETSPKFESFGPKSLNTNDIEILKYKISIANKDGSKTYLEYDNKLKQYNW